MKQSSEDENHWTIRVSKRFVVLSFVSSCLVAFAVGHIARILLIVNPHREFLKSHGDKLSSQQQQHQHQSIDAGPDARSKHNDGSYTLPDPVLQIGKTPPITTYTSKNFNTAKSTTSHSRWMVTEVGEEHDGGVASASAVQDESSEQQKQCRSSTNDTTATCEAPGEEEEHLPAGQHLLIDIEHVDGAFLNSEERLATAMLDLVNECGLTLLSYHCHGMHPSGVSCAGVLLESHVSFHTWPTEGVITLDLFTCGPNSLLPIVPLAERLFAVPSAAAGDTRGGATPAAPKMLWAHKFRGFGRQEGNADEFTDMFKFPVGIMNELKTEVGVFWVVLAMDAVLLLFTATCFFKSFLFDTDRKKQPFR